MFCQLSPGREMRQQFVCLEELYVSSSPPLNLRVTVQKSALRFDAPGIVVI
jgi:hypothetical protein